MDKSRELGSNRVTSALALPSKFSSLSFTFRLIYLREFTLARERVPAKRKKADEAGSQDKRER